MGAWLGMITVMAFPRRGDSYTECFYPALEAAGVTVREGMLAGRWLLEHLRGVDYVHIHWPSFFYNHPNPLRCLRGFAMLVFLVALARVRGARLIWTVHNLYPHDRCVVPGLHRLVRLLIVRMATRLLVHGPSAARKVERAFPAAAGRVVLIDHGHWRGHYPDSIDRSEARRRLGLAEDEFAFLFIGLCKPYKNLETLIRAVEELPPRAVLVIAGKFQEPAYEATIRTQIDASRARIVFRPGFVPDDEMQLYLKACDTVALPYLEILTSGGAMLALSFGRPVVAPALGFLRDTITAECGVLYDRADLLGLANALRAAMRTPFDEARIVAAAMTHDWTKSAETVRDALAHPEAVPAVRPEPRPGTNAVQGD